MEDGAAAYFAQLLGNSVLIEVQCQVNVDDVVMLVHDQPKLHPLMYKP